VLIFRADSFANNSLKLLTIAGLAAIPVIVLPGVYDNFRPIKEIAFRAQSILLFFALAAAVLYGERERLRELAHARAAAIVAALALIWSIITTATSTNRLLSAESLVTAICSVILFAAVWYASRSIPLAALLILVPVVIVNATLVTLQRYGIWNPFHFTVIVEQPFQSTALIGNPNEVGAYHLFAALLLLGVAIHTRGWQRWTAAAGFAFALGAILVSQTRAAILAIAVALVVLGARYSWKRAIAVVLLLGAGLAVATFVPIPGLTRMTRLPQLIAQRQWDTLLSNRLSPFLAAYEMFRDHPVTGVGPGVFAYEEMPYRVAVERKYGQQLVPPTGINFGETHNDHLQLLAESGLPGYLLFLAALAIVAGRGTATAGMDPRTRFAVTIGLPLAAAIVVLGLASFPLQIAVTRQLLLTAAALIVGWRAS